MSDLIHRNNIDVVCTGGLSLDCYKIIDVLDTVRKINSEIITVVGGGIMSSDPLTAMEVLNSDIGVIGQGENTMCDLANALDSHLPYSDMPGLIFRNGDNSLHISGPRKDIIDLDSMPFPDFEGFSYGKWAKCTGYGVIACSRSCTHSCTFCFHPSGQKYRQRSLDNIFMEIDYQVEHFGLKTLSLIDELFATKRDRVLEFCERIKTYNITWSCGLRVCDVDAELLMEMKKSGCVCIGYGLESADDSVLKSMRKGITVKQINRALDVTYEAGINIVANFIFGDISETKETATNTIEYWKRHIDRDYINLSFITVYPGTYLYKYALSTGLITDKKQFLLSGCPLINVSKLTEYEYNELASLIAELRLHPHVLCKSPRMREIRPDGTCTIEFECRKCGAIHSTELFFWFKSEYVCVNCGLINEVDPFETAVHRPELFCSRLPDSSNIAIWGAGGIYYKIARKYNLLSPDQFVLIDSDERLHGLSICNKRIYPPDEIATSHIDTVILTALSRKDEIYSAICSKYPSVTNVFTPAFDLEREGVVPNLQRIERVAVRESSL